jgi:hypothetical protein
MPVPMPSATEKSTTTNTSANAQTGNNASTQSGASANHAQKTQEELDAEKRYEEAMEEEYAKREGGA